MPERCEICGRELAKSGSCWYCDYGTDILIGSKCVRCGGSGTVSVGQPGRYHMTTCGKCNGTGKQQKG